MQAAWCLQGFATVFYAVFSVVLYMYIGSTVQSFSLVSLPPIWAKITLGIGLANFLVCVNIDEFSMILNINIYFTAVAAFMLTLQLN